jgi:hypothetical protein
MMIGFADPSVHGIYSFTGCFPNVKVNVVNTTDYLNVEAVLLSNVDPLYRSSAFLAGGQATLASRSSLTFQSSGAIPYWWDPWTGGCYCERFKKRAGSIGSFFAAIKYVPLGSNISWDGVPLPLPLGDIFCECTPDCTLPWHAHGRMC